jgi:CheY-like chemotaxis protein
VRIALVDDNPVVLSALTVALENVGHQVVAAASGRDLLARLGSEAPEIVVCDYRLAAGETGFDVVSSVRTALGFDLPAAIITGDTDPKLMRSMTKKGIAILHKPVDIEDLQEQIGEAMAARPQHIQGNSPPLELAREP